MNGNRTIDRCRCALAVGIPAALAAWMASGCAAAGGRAAQHVFGRSGTPWTIRCLEVRGSDPTRHVEQIAQTLRRTPGIRPADVRVSHDENGMTRLYYGTYLRQVDRKTGTFTTPPKMREDLALIRQLTDGSGAPYFLRAVPVIKPMPDIGNPEWKLSNVKATYSLQVAVFEPRGDFHDFRQAAADYCAFLRAKGYEAYYHHASASSMVTVGAFGSEAVRGESPVQVHYSPEVLALQRDELLKYNLVNGAIVRVKTPQGDVPVPSALVEIPNAKAHESW